MIHAAGVLFLAPGNRGLFLKRGPNSDHAGEWCFPGGGLEKDELPEDAAERETKEEIGFLPEGILVEHTRRQTESTDFTTFRQSVSAEFAPDPVALGKEHVGWAWAPVESPPEPLHPGCAIALARLSMDELGVARAIAAGQLTSPQRLDALALYAMRVSGTGVSYRRGLDEYVWRDPALYLSQDMIDRCAGLPVIMEHPEAATLNSEEFADRVVGGVMFGFVKDDELWCVARIYDADAIELMEKQQLSTSPAVVFKDPTVNSKTTVDGKTLLIEGKPSLLDHLAICQHGVWDKGGPATGIDVVRKDSIMSDEKEKADAARKDAEEKEKADAAKADAAKADADAGQKLDVILKHLDSLGKRMDAYDAKMDAAAADAAKKDAEEKEEEKKADKAKKDAEEAKGEDEKDDPKKIAADKSKKDESAEEEKKEMKENERDEKEKKDAARKDSDEAMQKQIADLQATVSRMSGRMPKPVSDEDYAAMATAQSLADSVFSAHSKSAPRPMDGETLIAYRRRLATELKHHSPEWKDVDLGVIAVDSKAFDNVEKRIYADAMEAAIRPNVDGGEFLREVRRRDPETGHLIKEYYGQPRAWMSQFSGGPPRLARFNLDNKRTS